MSILKFWDRLHNGFAAFRFLDLDLSFIQLSDYTSCMCSMICNNARTEILNRTLLEFLGLKLASGIL